MDIDDLLNYINDDNSETEKKKKKKKKKKNKSNEDEIIEEKNVIDNKEDEKIINKIEEKKEDIPVKNSQSKKHKKQKKVYLPKNINTDNENNSTNIPYPKRENKYRNLIKPSENIEIVESRFQDNSHLRLIKNWEEKSDLNPYFQTNFPTKSIDEQYTSLDCFSTGLIQEYNENNIWRSNNEEKKELEKYYKYTITSMRKAAECHRQIRKYAQTLLKPGIVLIDFVKKLENMLKFITNANDLECGQSFPTGVSINNIAAHDTPNSNDNTVLKYDDVMKLDFGTHINGYIIDCAFTVAFNPEYDQLLKCSQEATATGIKNAGIDMRLGELGGYIQEVIESYEVEIKGKVHKIKPIKDLCGHNMLRYHVHGEKSIPLYKNDEDNSLMEEGELYACETFVTTGKGVTKELKHCSHYMKDNLAFNNTKIKSSQPKSLFKYIDEHYSTLAFCPRWLEEGGNTNVQKSLNYLCNIGVVNPYPPLADIEGSYVAQFEHSFMLRPTCKEIFSIGDDY